MRTLPCGAVAALVVAAACQVANAQISSQEGTWVVARGADIAAKCADFMKAEYGSPEGDAALQNAELVRIVTAAPYSWRFYSRDRGVLIAIDVGRNVSPAVLRHGPTTIARSAEAVIRQEREMSIADHVKVVFIDPAAREPCGPGLYSLPVSQVTPAGVPWGREYETAPVHVAPPVSIPAGRACGCR